MSIKYDLYDIRDDLHDFARHLAAIREAQQREVARLDALQWDVERFIDVVEAGHRVSNTAELDDAFFDDGGAYTGWQYPVNEALDDDPCFYYSPEKGVARNTDEVLALDDE